MNIVKTLLLSITLCFSGGISGKDFSNNKWVIPQINNLKSGNGTFHITRHTTMGVENKEQAEVAKLFASLFYSASASFPTIKIGNNQADIVFVTNKNLKEEAYKLNVTSHKIKIEASGIPGFFYATQTLRQLLPADIEDKQKAIKAVWSIPAMTIEDEPRFGYRGLMLDVARYFIPKETVLKIVNSMGLLKLNKLHLHLVDDNGWRLEIKKYPKLTEVGAWKVERKVPFPDRRNPEPGEVATAGGFYSQQDIKEIIAYASKRQIEIIPEIEMPAHTVSSLAAYPSLACPIVKQFIGVLPGLGGKNSEIVYCAGNDRVFTFLENVIDEVTKLFPSRYIHLGGDEASKTNWKKCPLCQARMKAEHLSDEEELQSYFMKRMSKYVRSKGKEVIGWDELTNSELPEGCIIFGWQGNGNAAYKAGKLGHRFVMTPAKTLYLIRYQGPQWFEPLTYFGNNTLKNVYDYEPVQKDWDPKVAKLLMGVQASLWTEFCNTPEDVEYLIFPRLAALSEIAWGKKENKNWNGFLKRLDVFNKHLDKIGINYARSMYNIDHQVKPNKEKLDVTLSCIRPDMLIRYTTNGSAPTKNSRLYHTPLTISQQTVIRAATFSAGKQMGKTLYLKLGWNKATGKPVLGNNPNGYLLTNGLEGSNKQSDFEWCGWYDGDATFVVDLLKKESIDTIKIGFITNYGMAVHKPSQVKILVSDDNVNFREVSEFSFTTKEIFTEGTRREEKTINRLNTSGRFVKFALNNPGHCPDNHVRPGQPTWMYVDEVTIN